MMLRMRGEGRPWKDITAEWSRLTGTRPGASSLSVRYLHLKDKFKRMGDPDVSLGSSLPPPRPLGGIPNRVAVRPPPDFQGKPREDIQSDGEVGSDC